MTMTSFAWDDTEEPLLPKGPPAVPLDQAESMAEAAREIAECYRVLEKGGSNVVAEILRTQGTFYEWNHYPEGDVFDRDSHAQYYYHAHPSPLRESEHGHFHTFLRAAGMAEGLCPAPLPESAERPLGDDALSHLIAISMDRRGYPVRLFTTNRWVTGETWYEATDVAGMIDRFVIDHASPSWPTNRWISAMIRLFKPQILHLLEERDAAVTLWQKGHPEELVYEDRNLEVTSSMRITVDAQVKNISAALARLR